MGAENLSEDQYPYLAEYLEQARLGRGDLNRAIGKVQTMASLWRGNQLSGSATMFIRGEDAAADSRGVDELRVLARNLSNGGLNVVFVERVLREKIEGLLSRVEGGVESAVRYLEKTGPGQMALRDVEAANITAAGGRILSRTDQTKVAGERVVNVPGVTLGIQVERELLAFNPQADNLQARAIGEIQGFLRSRFDGVIGVEVYLIPPSNGRVASTSSGVQVFGKNRL